MRTKDQILVDLLESIQFEIDFFQKWHDEHPEVFANHLWISIMNGMDNLWHEKMFAERDLKALKDAEENKD